MSGIDPVASLPPLNNDAWTNPQPPSNDPATVTQPQQTPVLAFAGSTYTADSTPQFIAACQTLAPGSSINPSGTPIYLASDGIVAAISSSSVKRTLITPTAVKSAGQLTIAGATYTADSASQYVGAGQTLTPGGAITVSNTPDSLAIGGAMAVVGTSTQLLATQPPPTEAPILTFGGMAYIADASSAFSISSQVLTPRAPVTISNTPISLVPGGTIAVVGTSSQLLAPMTTPTETPVLTFNGMTYAAEVSSAFTIDGQTLTPGGAIFVSSTPISLAVGGTLAVVETSTQLLALTATFPEAPILSFQGTANTADASSAFTIDGQPHTKGAVITVNSTPLSLDAEGPAAVIGSSTQILGTATIAGSDAATITFSLQTYPEEAVGDFIIGGQTITVSGTPVSFAAGGMDVVVGSSTEAVGVGGWIMSRFGPGDRADGGCGFLSGREREGDLISQRLWMWWRL